MWKRGHTMRSETDPLVGQLGKVPCREGSCKHKATTIIQSKPKGKLFTYYLCDRHWKQLLTIWNKASGF